MASASARSRPFAQLVCLQDLCPSERTRANPSERRTLPFLPRPVRRPRPPLRLAGHPGPSALELLAAIVDVHPRVPIRTRLQRGRALIVGRKSIGGSLARSAEDPAPPSPYRSYATAATVTASGPRRVLCIPPGRDRGAASSRLISAAWNCREFGSTPESDKPLLVGSGKFERPCARMQRAYFRSCACAGTRTPLGLPLRGPVGYVRDIAFSPDRKLIAAAGSRHTVISELMVRRRSRSARTASPWQSHAPTQSLRCTTSERGTRRASLSVTGSLAISTSAQTESCSRRQPWAGAGACSSGTSRARASPPHSQAHSPRMPFACRRGTESSSLSATAPAKSCAGSLTHHIEGAWAARPVGQELTGHNGGVDSLDFQPNGSTLVTLVTTGNCGSGTLPRASSSERRCRPRTAADPFTSSQMANTCSASSDQARASSGASNPQPGRPRRAALLTVTSLLGGGPCSSVSAVSQRVSVADTGRALRETNGEDSGCLLGYPPAEPP
jgi:hypothetical protein